MLFAIPASHLPFLDTLPDNTVVKIYKHGDEYFHWLTDENGQRVEKDSTGFYKELPPFSSQQIQARRQISRLATPTNALLGVATKTYRPPKILVVLVSFQDVPFKTSKATIEAMFCAEQFTREYTYYNNGESIHVQSSGSVRQYFSDASEGQYVPQFTVVGPYTLSQNRRYYGANNPSTDEDVRPEEMVVEAATMAYNNAQINFSNYDSNGDGDVDVVTVLYAGYSEADVPENSKFSECIWPHQYALEYKYYGSQYKADVRFNGKRINRYVCCNELSYRSNLYTGIGSVCHELSHILGLPDLYSTSGASVKTLGDWDIMDHGGYNNDGNTPPTYSGYERFFMGWTTPTILHSDNIVTINEMQESNQVFLASPNGTHNLVGNNPTPSEFYILENRQQKNWDAFLPGHGLLLTKIKYTYDAWTNNKVNYQSKNMRVDIIEADGKAPKTSYGKAGDAFPTGATSFNDSRFNLSIQNIREENQILYLTFLQTALTAQPSDNKAACYKTVENGALVIHKNGKKYNILGNTLRKP